MGRPVRHAGRPLSASGRTLEQHAKGGGPSCAVRFCDELLVRPRDTAPPSPFHPRRLVGKLFATRYRDCNRHAAPHLTSSAAGETRFLSISSVRTAARRVGDVFHRHVVGRTVLQRCRRWLPVSEYLCRLPFLDRWSVGAQSRSSCSGTLLLRRASVPGISTDDDENRSGGWQSASLARDRLRGAFRR